jgi:hypothetical protein
MTIDLLFGLNDIKLPQSPESDGLLNHGSFDATKERIGSSLGPDMPA